MAAFKLFLAMQIARFSIARLRTLFGALGMRTLIVTFFATQHALFFTH